MHKRLAVTDLVPERFYRSQRGLKVVLFSSPTGCRLCSDGFRPGKGGDSLQPSDDLSAMRRRSIGATSATGRCSVAKWFPSMRWSFVDGFAEVIDLSVHTTSFITFICIDYLLFLTYYHFGPLRLPGSNIGSPLRFFFLILIFKVDVWPVMVSVLKFLNE